MHSCSFCDSPSTPNVCIRLLYVTMPPFAKLTTPLRVLLLVLLCMWDVSATDCKCGYEVPGPNAGESWLFTEVIETDFTRLRSIASAEEWQRQEFNVSAEAGRGKYPKMFSPDNIAVGPGVANKDANERRAGVELSVGATITNGAVPVAEMDTARQDLFWGSFRAGMKLTAVKGTCAAFFWVRKDDRLRASRSKR